MKQKFFSRVIIERSTGAGSTVVIIQCSPFLALSFQVSGFSLITNLEVLSIKLSRVSKNRPVGFSTYTCLHS